MKGTILKACGSASVLAMAIAAMPALAQVAPASNDPAAQSATAQSGLGQPVPTGGDTVAQPGDIPDAQESTEDIVVTASAGERSRFRSSISVSQLSQESIQNFTPRSEAEVLRNIPGLQPSDTAGPGGNANIGVRGIPVSTGGSEYVALQEDGLPTVLFGDMNFGNNDYWLRFDQNVSRVEAVRGGSASTFGSQAPGAVINYLSKTGEQEGGQIAYSNGLGYREHRVDFDYGAPINDGLRFHIGGYAREGGGLTNERFNILRGYQVKANVTKDLGDRGFVRLYFKRLDERAPTNTTTPSIATLDGDKVTGFSPLPTFDGRDGSSYSIYNRSFQYLRYDGLGVATADVEGISPEVTGIGAQVHYDVADWLTLDDTIRYQDISGNFTTQFINVQARTGTGGVIGSTVNGSVVGSLRYAAGPLIGQTYTGTFVNNNPNINTLMKDMGNFANNFTARGKFDIGAGRATVTAGWFHMRQDIVQDWHVNRQYSELNGENAAPLDLFSTTGTKLTAAGQAGFNDNWGTCCARRVDLTYTDNAPFLQVGYDIGGLNLDASVRYDNVHGEGTAQGGITGPVTLLVDRNGAARIPSLVLNPTVERIDYNDDYVSWSVGALYAVSNETSLFARASRGGRFNADRRVLAGQYNATTGALIQAGNFNADGSLTAQGRAGSINFLQQQEVGIKQRGGVFGGSYSVEVTGFHSTLTENNFDFTRISNPAPNNDPNISNSYRSFGIEFTSRVTAGNFHLAVDATYADSKITDSATAALVDKRPGGLPDFLYVVSPSYDAGLFAAGVSVNGQTSTKSDDFNTYTIRGTTFVNGFVTVRPIDRIELGVNVNNLFDTLGFRGGGSIGPAVGANRFVFNNTALYGRTVTGSIRYRF